MRLSKAPNLGTNARLGWTVLAVTLIAAGALALTHHDIVKTLGDTDDAMRLVLVRRLRQGGGWYDQLVVRLQPPFGVYMHWSRLLDGVLAGLMSLLGLFLSPSSAELVVRFAWPLTLIAPAVASGLFVVRRLGGEAAVFVGAVLMLANMELYGQFRPGRVDHHNVQIVMTMIAVACAVAPTHRRLCAMGAGAATGLGLAIGVEALPFLALVGAGYAMNMVFDHKAAKATRAYAVSLLACSAALFALQTPPWRWSLSFCDAIGFNLIAAIAVGAIGLAAVSTWAVGQPRVVRAGLAGGIGLAVLAVYLTLDPACWHGPLAAVDPRLRPIWFDSIQELLPWPRLLQAQPRDGIRSITTGVIGILAAIWLAARSVQRRDGSAGLLVVLILAAVAEAAMVYRAEDYELWFVIPVLAAGLSDLAQKAWNQAMVPTVAVSLLASPVGVATAAVLAIPTRAAAPSAAIADHCLENGAYDQLAREPKGIVLGEIDLGSFILANTAHAVISAPYHRMTWGILSAHNALAASPAAAESLVERLNADYVVVCPAHGVGLPPTSLATHLARGDAPVWLQELSAPTAALRIFKVKKRPA